MKADQHPFLLSVSLTDSVEWFYNEPSRLIGYPPEAFQFAFIQFQSLHTLKCERTTSQALGALFAELALTNFKGGLR